LVASIRIRILLCLAGYFAFSTLFAWLLGRWLARPLTELQHRSRRIASGDYRHALSAATSLREVAELRR